MPIGRIKRGHGDLRGQVDWARVNATAGEEIAQQIAEDDAERMREAALKALEGRSGLASRRRLLTM